MKTQGEYSGIQFPEPYPYLLICNAVCQKEMLLLCTKRKSLERAGRKNGGRDGSGGGGGCGVAERYSKKQNLHLNVSQIQECLKSLSNTFHCKSSSVHMHSEIF